MYEKLDLVIDAKATLGEGPCWDSDKQTLYWVDIMEKKVHIYDTARDENRFIDVGQYIGAAVLRKSGGLVVALQNGFYFLDTDTETLTPVNDPEAHLPGNRFNDGKCDAYGRFWAGTMGMDSARGVGSLYYLDTDHRIKAMVTDVTISNGIAWSHDNKTMYYIDTPTMQVSSFDYDIDSGELKNRRVVITIPENQGAPDGMTIDKDGMLWIAHWGGYRVSRWNPGTGQLLEFIPVPAAYVTSCTFGGKNMDELYITTARIGLEASALSSQPHAGGVFKIKTNTQGLSSYAFKG